MLNYEVLEGSLVDVYDQWMQARYEIRRECSNQYKSIMMSKINKMPYDYERIISSITHHGWESVVTNDMVIKTVEEMIQDAISSPYINGEILAYYSGTIGIEDFFSVKQCCAMREGSSIGIEAAQKAEVDKISKKLSYLESQIQKIVKEVIEFREYSGIHSAIDLSILESYVRGQLLMRETQAVMEAYEILDSEVISIIIRKYVPECHQLV